MALALQHHPSLFYCKCLKFARFLYGSSLTRNFLFPTLSIQVTKLANTELDYSNLNEISSIYRQPTRMDGYENNARMFEIDGHGFCEDVERSLAATITESSHQCPKRIGLN